MTSKYYFKKRAGKKRENTLQIKCCLGHHFTDVVKHCALSQQVIKTASERESVLQTPLSGCRTSGGHDLDERPQCCGRICAVVLCICARADLCAHMKSTLTGCHGICLICSTVHSLLPLMPIRSLFCNLSIYCRLGVVEGLLLILIMLSD